MPREFLVVTIKRLNVARPVCNHLVGKEHVFAHRALVGIIVMASGVFIAKFVGHSDNVFLAGVGDLIGYALHGVGLTPFIEELLQEK